MALALAGTASVTQAGTGAASMALALAGAGGFGGSGSVAMSLALSGSSTVSQAGTGSAGLVMSLSGSGSAGGMPPVAGYVAWWDASQITGLADAASVSSWADLSGNGYNWTQSTGADQPTYYKTTAGKLVNGLPAVWFNGSTDKLQNTGPTYGTANTYFIVCSGATGSSEYITGTSDTQGGGPAFIFGFVANELEYYNDTVGGGGTDRQTFGSPASATFAACWAQTDTVNLAGYYQSGSSVFSITPVNGDSTIFNKWWGAAQGTSNFYNGAICEGIVYASQLNSTQIDSVLTYLTTKWG